MSYVYTPLQDPSSEIRLLKIQAAPKHGFMIATISTFSTKKAPAYAAISYTWGEASPRVPVILDGRKVQVRHNCRYALWQSSLHNMELWIWIDSICINQEDIEEKNSQVGIMGNIFSEAKLVFACVGPHADDSAFICRTLSILEKKTGKEPPLSPCGRMTSHGGQVKPVPISWTDLNFRESMVKLWIQYLVPPYRPWTQHLGRLQILTEYLPADRSLERLRMSCEKFVQRRYWMRLWVLQELVLAKGVYVLCGSDSMLWAGVSTIFDALARSLKLVSGRTSPTTLMTAKLFQNIGTKRIWRTDRERWETISSLKLDCKDIRDRIFGTLGIVQWGEKTVSYLPDYNMACVDLAVEILTRGHLIDEETPATMVQYARYLIELLQITSQHIDREYQAALSPRQLSSGHTIKNRFGFHVWLPECQELVQARASVNITGDELNQLFDLQIFSLSKLGTSRREESHPEKPGFRTVVVRNTTIAVLHSDVQQSDIMVPISARYSPNGHNDGTHWFILVLILRPDAQGQIFAIVASGLLDSKHFYMDSDGYYSHYFSNTTGAGRFGTLYLHPLDVLAQAVRNERLYRAVAWEQDVDMFQYLTAPFTHRPGSSYFVASSESVSINKDTVTWKQHLGEGLDSSTWLACS